MKSNWSVSYQVWTLEDISRGATDIHGYECEAASFKHAMKAFGWPLNLDHVVTDFSERNPPRSITNEVRDDTFGEWECLELHIPEQITASSRRRLVRLVGAKDWRTRREPTTSAQRGTQPSITSGQARGVAAKPATCGTCAFCDQNDCCTCEASRYKGEKMYSFTTCEFAMVGVRVPRPRFKHAKMFAFAMLLVFAAWLWSIGHHADGYATGQMLYCQDDGRSNCDQRYWEAFCSAARRNAKDDVEGFAFAGAFLALLLGVSYLLGRASKTGHNYDGPYDPGL